MKSCFSPVATVALAAALVATAPAQAGDPWRSTLYPEDWEPGDRDSQGRFLHDFSYAGYHRGLKPLPPPDFDPGLVVDATQPPYLADPSGVSDSTAAIQEALDEVSKRGGGVVLLPAGTYRVHPRTIDDKAALYINTSGVVLRGAGADQTFLFNTETSMRTKNVIRMAPHALRDTDFDWRWNVGEPSYPIIEDLAELDTTVSVDGGDFAVGEWVLVLSDATDEFIAEHNMTGVWTRQGFGGVTFYRRIVGIDGNRLTLDIPIRYPVLLRDNARVVRTIPHIEETAVEFLSIGMKSIDSGSMGDDDWNVPGTGAYEVHASSLIEVNHVVNGWIRGVWSFRHWENYSHHFLSTGIRIRYARSITVENVHLERSQYHGEGGNGYHFSIQGSDNLITRCSSERARHNFTIGRVVATGNVIHRCTAAKSNFPVDFHMHLSPANLIDSMVLDDDSIEAVRRNHADHGHTATQSVIWNTRGDTEGWEVDLGIKKLVRSAQFGWGYVIGTSGNDRLVDTPNHQLAQPVDFVEGQGAGASLIPSSLYESQLRRRLARLPVRPGASGRLRP